jgi:hypothetical protein
MVDKSHVICELKLSVMDLNVNFPVFSSTDPRNEAVECRNELDQHRAMFSEVTYGTHYLQMGSLPTLAF